MISANSAAGRYSPGHSSVSLDSSWNFHHISSSTGTARPNASAAQSQILATRRRSALPITDTELKLMAAAAIMGLNRIPKVG
jgi:hypothetical protein